VGMLLDPSFLIANIPAVAAVVAVVVVAKAAAAFAIVAILGQPPRVGLTVAAGLAQVGEFSFILATTAVGLGLIPVDGVQLVVAAAIVSITLNPVLFAAIDPTLRRIASYPRIAALTAPRSGDISNALTSEQDESMRSHAVVVGSGRVARLVMGGLARRGFPFVVISDDRHDVERIREQGRLALYGDATNVELLTGAHTPEARVIVVAISDEHAARLVVDRARELNPRIALVVRTHSGQQMDDLGGLEGSVQAIHGEIELGVQMTRYTLRRFGVSSMEAEAVAEGLRGRRGRPWPLEPDR